MPDTHDERGGDEDVVTPEKAAFELRYWLDTRTGTDRLGRDVGIVLDALAAATARADDAGARLAELRPVRTEWSTENTCDHPDDAIVDRAIAVARVVNYPQCYSSVLTRQVYAGPWLRAGGLVAGPGRALSATETDADGSQGSGLELEFGMGSAGPSACCRATKVEGGVRHHCDSDAPHDTHECGDCAHRWDDTTEDGRHG